MSLKKIDPTKKKINIRFAEIRQRNAMCVTTLPDALFPRDIIMS